jgi:hypothetical protein
MSWAGRTIFHRCQVPFFNRGFLLVPAGGGLGRHHCGAGGAGGDGQEGVGEHGQGGVPVPGPVLADLVVVEAGLALGFREAVLDSPARARDRDELGQGDGAGRPAAEERQLDPAFLAGLQRAPCQQVMILTVRPDERPVVKPRPLGPVGAAQPLPPAFRNQGGQRVSPQPAPATGMTSLQAVAMT